MQDGTVRRRTALFTVSEYGEFSSLVEVATLVDQRLGLHPFFLFREDYGALDAHSQILETKSFSWATASDPLTAFDARQEAGAWNDYVPTNVLRDGGKAGGAEPARKSRAAATRGEHASALLRLRLHAASSRLRGVLGLVRRSRPSRGGPRRRWSLKAHYRCIMRELGALFDAFDPAIVISGQDYPLSITTLAAKVAADRGIATAIIPFSMTPTTKEIAESFFGARVNELRSKPLLRAAERVAPHWLHRYRGRTYTRLPLAEALASDALGLTPPQPWTPNSGRGIVFAPSRQGYDYCVSAGIAESQLRLAGALWGDRIGKLAGSLSQRREELLREVMIFENFARNVARGTRGPKHVNSILSDPVSDDVRLLVFSWPPDQAPRRPTGFSDFVALSDALIEMLLSLALAAPVKVVVSLHPTLVGGPIDASLRRAGLYVADRPLFEIIDCADIFCATVSSTLLWALHCGIPAVNFDIYRYGYAEFRSAGMCEATTLPQLRSEFFRLIGDPGYRESVSKAMLATRDYWTMSDGRSRERIIALLSGLMRAED